LVRNHLPQVVIYQIVTFPSEQDVIKVNNLIVVRWSIILSMRGGVSNGVIAISATLTSRSWLCLHFYLPKFIDSENWPANSQYLNPVEFSVWGALQQKLYR